jgi:hypothetical protein
VSADYRTHRWARSLGDRCSARSSDRRADRKVEPDRGGIFGTRSGGSHPNRATWDGTFGAQTTGPTLRGRTGGPFAAIPYGGHPFGGGTRRGCPRDTAKATSSEAAKDVDHGPRPKPPLRRRRRTWTTGRGQSCFFGSGQGRGPRGTAQRQPLRRRPTGGAPWGTTKATLLGVAKEVHHGHTQTRGHQPQAGMGGKAKAAAVGKASQTAWGDKRADEANAGTTRRRGTTRG